MSELQETISFRPLTLDDMPQMSAWLSDPVVSEWYGEGEASIEHLNEKYAPGINNREPTRGFICLINEVDVGYIQAVPIDGYPEYQVQLQLEPGAIGIDIFLGDERYRGRGIGSEILRTFTERIVFGQLRASFAVIGPDPANTRAVRSYEKAGFSWLKTVYVSDEDRPDENGEEYLMIRYPERTGESD